MRRLLICLLLALPLISGCAFLPIFSPIVTAVVTWVGGEAHAYYAADSVQAYNAVKRSLAKLDQPVLTDEAKEDGDYYITAGNNDRFKIKVTRIEPYITKVSIRVNFMGDKPYAELIYLELQSQMDVIDYEKMQKRRRFRRSR